LDDWVSICPTAARFGFESFYASGRIELARALIEKDLKEPSDRLLDIFYTCTGCGACVVQCRELSGVDLDQVELFEAVKAYFYSQGWGPLAKHKEFAENTRIKHNPYGEPHEDRFKWFNGDNSTENSDNSLVYFVGCTSSYRQKEIAEATVKVLQASNTPFTVLGPDEWCCGSPMIRTGQWEDIQELAAHNIEAIEKLGAEKVIFSCAGCYQTFKNDYRNLGFTLPFKIQHTTQFFLNLIRKKKLKINPIDKSATYHDPCHLGRQSKVYRQPRSILKHLGIDLREMPRNKENAWCCGAGSGVRAAYPEFASWSAKNRLGEAIDTDVEILASACPFCKNNFIETLKSFSGKKLEVCDISELLVEGLDEK
jgi:heterodisulfide reductase subunit D